MAIITDIIDLIHPSDNSMGIILSDTVWVLFDRELDETSISNGNLIVEGPDTDSFIGPDVSFTLPNVSDSGSDDQLQSPGYQGIVPGKVTFQRVNLLDLNLYTGPDDTAGVGNLWRTKAIFTPSFPFQKLTEYKVYLAGDEVPGDTTPTGIRSRTVFDVVNLGGNTGTGTVSFSGSYIGPINDTYHVKITTAGASGFAWFEYWTASSSSVVEGPILTDAYGSQTLSNGVTVRFNSGNFHVNDEFTVVVKTPTIFSDNTYWIYTTGTGSIQSVPTSTSTSITGQPQPLIPSILKVVSILPADRATNLPITTNRIILTFNKNVNTNTVTADSVSISGAPVNGDESVLTTRKIYSDITVTGNKIILDI